MWRVQRRVIVHLVEVFGGEGLHLLKEPEAIIRVYQTIVEDTEDLAQ